MVKRAFIDEVKEALDLAYNYDLEKVATDADWTNESFDLVEHSKRAVVVIRRPSNTSSVVENLEREATYFNSLVLTSGDILNYIMVMESTFEDGDKRYFEELLGPQLKGNISVMDNNDIADLFEQYNNRNSSRQQAPTKGNSNFATEEELKNLGFEEVSKKSQSSQAFIPEEYSDPYTSASKYSNEDFSERKVIIQEWLTSAENQKRPFYIAASVWGGKNYWPQFLEEENWFHDGDFEMPLFINEIDIGSVLFLRDGETSDKASNHLVLSSLGVVTENKLNGKDLSVRWLILENNYQFDNMRNYNRHVIDFITRDDLEVILAKLTAEQFGFLQKNLDTINWTPSAPTIAGLISDADIGADYLDITKDVSAFARVMAAKSFLPPLAIALFGKWGSGKSFFMRKLKEEIDSLANNNEAGLFCDGIAQVHFNAWSYMDSSLWASMVTRIFEGLQQYIGNNTPAEAQKQLIEKALTEKLNITNEELDRLKNKKKAVEDRLISLESKKEDLETELNEKIKELHEKTLISVIEKVDSDFQVEDKINAAIKNNPSAIKNRAAFEEIVPKNYWSNADTLYEQTNSTTTFLKVFFDKANWWKNIIWLIVIIAIIVIVPLGVAFIADLVGTTNLELSPEVWGIITLLGGIGVKSANAFNKLQPLIASFWEIKKEYHEAKDKATSNFYRDQKAIEMEIESFRREIETIAHQITLTEQEQVEIQFRLENTLSTEALYTFIERKSESKDYAKHLGIISTIRKDFEILSELFTDHNDEVRKVKKEDAEKFRNFFDRPLERIILYIDDLDRCPEERVVEVLEAVNLLMAYPLFVVVVGVDPRWVKNALYKRHQLQFQELDENDGIEMISPSAYLEKIFQVPFNLKNASDTSVKHMLKTLAETEPILRDEAIESVSEEIKENIEDIKITSEVTSNSSDDRIVSEADRRNEKSKTPAVSLTENVAKITVSIESLVFSEIEIKNIQSMSLVVGSSPRAIKRFINIFRIVKAHEDYPNNLPEAEINAVLFLLALPIGRFRRLYNSFVLQLEQNKTQQNLEKFCTSIKNSKSSDPDAQRAATNLLTVLKKEESDLLSIAVSSFATHYPLIKRFSYVID